MNSKCNHISRREFVKTTGFGGLVLGLGSNVFDEYAQGSNAPGTGREQIRGNREFSGPYNILFILVDQESYFKEYPRDLGLPGHERLKANGVSFENHYISSSVCTPSRSVIFTGQHIVHNGMFDNTNFAFARQHLPSNIPTLGHMMRKADYYTVYKGKWHLSADFEQPAEGPWRLLREEMEQYGFADYDSLGDLIGHTQGGYQNDHLVAGNAIRWLRTKGEQLRAKSQPWLMVTSLVNPHDIMYFNADPPDKNLQDNGKLLMKTARAPRHPLYERTYDYPLPKTLFQSLTEKGRPRAHHEIVKVNNLFLGTIPPDKAHYKRFQDYYFNCIAHVDTQINRLLEELDNLGLTDNTIIIFTADHGEMRGAHGMRNKGQNAYEEDNHVPFIIVHPEIQGGQTCKAVTTHVDIIPTVVSLSKAPGEKKYPIVKDLVGKDITPLLTNPAQAGLNDLRMGGLFVYSMFTALDADYWRKFLAYKHSGKNMSKIQEAGIVMDFSKRCHIRSVFDGRYKFSRYFAPKQHNRPETLEQILKYNDIELFDLQEDPHEERNQGIDPAGNKKLILAMNEKLNTLIDSEIGEDVGQMLPKTPGMSWAVTKFDL
ncbi:MAG: sulfatase-like hydrolase/transferase [Planctomycetota bacterium]|jgi:arylsulfatase